MVNTSRYKRGWFGNSVGHAMAAKGIKSYSSKQILVDPSFYATKHEDAVSYNDIFKMVKQNDTYQTMINKYPNADKEDLRLRAIKAIDSHSADSTLSFLNTSGVDTSINLAKSDGLLRKKIFAAISDRQKSSFLPSIKVELLKKRLKELK